MRAKLNKLNEHYVLYGFGRVGRQVAHEFTIVRGSLRDRGPEPG